MSDRAHYERHAEQQAKSRRRQELAAKHLRYMKPKHRFELARAILEDLIDNGEVTYAEFSSAQAAERYIRQARNALRGIN